LSFDGASIELVSSNRATRARFGAASCRSFTVRSPRPDVSPSCPEHGGLASRPVPFLLARARAAVQRAGDQRAQSRLAGACQRRSGRSREVAFDQG